MRHSMQPNENIEYVQTRSCYLCIDVLYRSSVNLFLFMLILFNYARY